MKSIFLLLTLMLSATSFAGANLRELVGTYMGKPSIPFLFKPCKVTVSENNSVFTIEIKDTFKYLFENHNSIKRAFSLTQKEVDLFSNPDHFKKEETFGSLVSNAHVVGEFKINQRYELSEVIITETSSRMFSNDKDVFKMECSKLKRIVE